MPSLDSRYFPAKSGWCFLKDFLRNLQGPGFPFFQVPKFGGEDLVVQKNPSGGDFQICFFLFSAQPGDMIQVDVCIFFKWVETRHHHLVIYCLQRDFFRTSAEQ